MYPIMMTTYERPDYFEKTLKSLEETGVDLSNLHIFDDCSKDSKKKMILDSLKSSYKVHVSSENKGTTLNTIPNIDFMFKTYQAEYVILIQDDILFSPHWLEKGIKIFERIKSLHSDVGYLSLFNRTNNNSDQYYIMHTGHPGGVALIIDRNFWDAYSSNFDVNDYGIDKLSNLDRKRMHFVKNVYDYKLAIRAVSIGWKIAYVGKSLVLHIGNLCSMPDGRDKTYIYDECMRNFVGFK